MGDTGIVVAAENPAALAGAMDRLLECLAQSPNEMRYRARAWIIENFSIGLLVDWTEALLDALI